MKDELLLGASLHSSIERPLSRSKLDLPINVSQVCGKMMYIEADQDFWIKRDQLASPQGEFYFKLSNAVSSLKRYRAMINVSGHDRKQKLQGVTPPKVILQKNPSKRRVPKSTVLYPLTRGSSSSFIMKKSFAVNRVVDFSSSIDS